MQTNAHGEPISRWKTDPAGMIAKCAEALALRRAFPHELSGLYTTEEMGQADNPQNGNGAVAVVSSVVETPTTTTRISGQRPFSPQDLRSNFTRAVAAIEAKGLLLGPDDFAITEGALRNLLESEQDLERYLEYVTGIPYLEDMSEAHVVGLLRLLKPTNVDGNFIPCEEAQSEAAEVISWLDASQDQATEENNER